MLDRVIHKHLDGMDAINEDIDKKIDDLMKAIDIDFFISDPQSSFETLVEIIYDEIASPASDNALKEGIKLVKDIKDDEVIIQDTENGSINKGVVDV